MNTWFMNGLWMVKYYSLMIWLSTCHLTHNSNCNVFLIWKEEKVTHIHLRNFLKKISWETEIKPSSKCHGLTSLQKQVLYVFLFEAKPRVYFSYNVLVYLRIYLFLLVWTDVLKIKNGVTCQTLSKERGCQYVFINEYS